ncbi:hypothetical protein RVF87_18030 [Gordonia hydrophobica]|uniref:Uncharacterized protein n=1 Tax=Gordonia hydrophobica TaxID=40516 RepID=A0ABZ2TZY0_9ACTN
MTAIIAIIVLAFSWPALTADPQGISIAVTGPQQAVSTVEQQLSSSGEIYDVNRPGFDGDRFDRKGHLFHASPIEVLEGVA